MIPVAFPPQNLNLEEVQKSSFQSLRSKGEIESLTVHELLRRGNLRLEKCELRDAGSFFEAALEKAKQTQSIEGISDSLAHLLRYSSEIGESAQVQRWIQELDLFITENEGRLTPYAWYCRGIVSFRSAQYRKAQVLFHRFWREVRPENGGQDLRAQSQALIALSLVAQARGNLKRAQYLGEVVLRFAEEARPRGILCSTYLMLCRTFEKRGDVQKCKQLLQKAFAEAISEHHWYHFLYVLYGYARVHRMEQDFSQAKFYLDLLEQAVKSDEFKNLKREVAEERVKLNLYRVDLEILVNASSVRTREKEISFGRQHLLLDILKALSLAHPSGLSKKEIVEKVWRQPYDPDHHDGKLYYNINRLRKMLEVNVHQPQYLVSWRQGYRLSPDLRLRVQKGE